MLTGYLSYWFVVCQYVNIRPVMNLSIRSKPFSSSSIDTFKLFVILFVHFLFIRSVILWVKSLEQPLQIGISGSGRVLLIFWKNRRKDGLFRRCLCGLSKMLKHSKRKKAGAPQPCGDLRAMHMTNSNLLCSLFHSPSSSSLPPFLSIFPPVSHWAL